MRASLHIGRLAAVLVWLWTGAAHALASDSRIDLLLSVSGDLHDQSEQAIARELAGFSGLRVIDARGVAASDDPAELLIGIGGAACRQMARTEGTQPLLCLMISRRTFMDICEQGSSHALHAIVADQPARRLATVASHLYPDLREFAVLAADASSIGVDARLRISDFIVEEALDAQVTRALMQADALIATPDRRLFNADTLATVLMTAYGYDKPLIGFSPATVEAGALMTSFTSPQQALRQVVELLPQLLEPDAEPLAEVIDPKYFSILENPDIARSLGLDRADALPLGDSFSDEDFTS